MSDSITHLQYPIGKFIRPQTFTEAQIQSWIGDIVTLPEMLRLLVEPFDNLQLEIPYRPDGWTVRQVVHHLADSHLNSYIRFKLALTEDRPTIKPYHQELWAKLPDNSVSADISLDLLESLHARWAGLLRAMTFADFKREFMHPETGLVNLGQTLALYSWHGRHHYAHIKNLAASMHWL